MRPQHRPAPAIAAIGPAKLDKLLGAKGDAAVAAIAAADIDLRLVEKFHGAPQEPRPSRLSAARQMRVAALQLRSIAI